MHRILVVLAIATASLSALGEPAVTTPLPEALHSSIGYSTVEAALTELRAMPGVDIREKQGWIIISDKKSGNPVLWSFTPPGHPAHPSAVKRIVTEKNGAVYIEMKVLCQAGKTPCDALVREFQVLNDRIKEELQNKTSQSRPANQPPQEINITSDSAPGWLPSADQRAQVPQVVKNFLATLDGGQYLKAYGLMTEGQKKPEPFDEFAKRVTEFNAQAGPVKERRIIKVTWTKDPANAPGPGIYVAVDLVSRFTNIDRHCGFIVLYQRDAGAPFQVARQEDNYITDAQARQIELKRSPQAVNDIWGQLARNCPNYEGSKTK